MRAAVLLVCVLGCGRIWDPDSYRGDGVDVGVVDSSVDAAEIDAGDGDPDVGVDAASDAPPVDVGMLDAQEDAPDVDTGVCSLDARVGPIEVRSNLSNLDVDYDGPGPALRVSVSGVVIENLNITLRGPATGILVEPESANVQINNVRIRKMGRRRINSPSSWRVRPEGSTMGCSSITSRSRAWRRFGSPA